MKEATGELNMTVITVIAIAAIGVFLWAFLPGILDSIQQSWQSGQHNCGPNQHAVYNQSTKTWTCVNN